MDASTEITMQQADDLLRDDEGWQEWLNALDREAEARALDEAARFEPLDGEQQAAADQAAFEDWLEREGEAQALRMAG